MKNHISKLGYEERAKVTAATRSKSTARNNAEAAQNLNKERMSATGGIQTRADGGVLNTKSTLPSMIFQAQLTCPSSPALKGIPIKSEVHVSQINYIMSVRQYALTDQEAITILRAQAWSTTG